MSSRQLSNVLSAEVCRIPLRAESKREVICELLDVLDKAGVLGDRAEAERVVLEREALMSTGLENGIAIPHGKTDTVDQLYVAVGVKPLGMDFACADGQPARIIILTLSPASTSGPHIRFMADVTRLLSDAARRERLCAASTPAQALAIFQEGA
jgi:PTS system nitrogen regulatory IIA component